MTRPRPRNWRSTRAVLVLLAAVLSIGLLWACSYRRADVITFYTQSGNVQALASIDGSLVLVFSSISLGRERALLLQWEVHDPQFLINDAAGHFKGNMTDHARFGFGFTTGGADPEISDGHWWSLRIRDQYPTAVAVGGLLFYSGRLGRSVRRRKSGLCEACGYDLRASFGRCPECGGAG